MWAKDMTPILELIFSQFLNPDIPSGRIPGKKQDGVESIISRPSVFHKPL